MIRFAKEEDMLFIMGMFMEFHADSPYRTMKVSVPHVMDTVTSLIRADNNQSIVLLYEMEGRPVGLLAATKTQFALNGDFIGTEMVWWVDPQYRKSTIGNELREAFEFWAKTVGCTHLQMVTLKNGHHDLLSRYYKRQGYEHSETSFLKEI